MKSFPAKAGTTLTASTLAKSRPLSPIRNEEVRNDPLFNTNYTIPKAVSSSPQTMFFLTRAGRGSE